MTEDDNSISLGPVHITDTEISQISDGILMIKIPKSEITRIELKRTIAAERPFIQFAFGLLLTVPGFLSSRVLLAWLLYGGTLYADVTLIFLLLIPVGLWFAFTAFRKRNLFHVYTHSDKRKILCDPTSTPEELRRFATEAEVQFGYSVFDMLYR